MEVWHLAKKLVIDIYNVSRNFPVSERYGLASQINRAVVSVASNLAEGSSRMSQKDQAHFSQFAYSSLMETICQLDIANDLKFIKSKEYGKLRQSIAVLSGKINALYQSQKRRIK